MKHPNQYTQRRLHQTTDEMCKNSQHKVSELPLDLCLMRLVWVSNDWAVIIGVEADDEKSERIRSQSAWT